MKNFLRIPIENKKRITCQNCTFFFPHYSYVTNHMHAEKYFLGFGCIKYKKEFFRTNPTKHYCDSHEYKNNG